MLIKCKECQKDVSSEAANCPHCGFPVKPQPKAEEIPIVREANSSKSGLGTFFIILGIIGIIIGFIVIQPSDYEQFLGEHLRDVDSFQSKLDTASVDRHVKAACFFIPAGILFVLGLVLRASAKPNT
jgi:hypothetical protein